jgi:hypothetical protein
VSGLSDRQLAAVYSLVADLRLRGFAVGTDHYLRLERLLSRVEQTHSPAELEALLGPLFATDQKRQEEFHQVFARHFPSEGLAMAAEIEPVESQSPTETARGPRRRLWIPIALCALLVAGVLAYLGLTKHLVGPVEVPPEPSAPITVVVTPNANTQAPPEKVSYGPLLVLFLFLLLVHQGLRYRRRHLALERARQRKPPVSWPIKARTPEIRDYRSDLFFRTARLLRQRRISDAERLDIPRSIAATIEARGFPTLRTKPDSVFPEYLVLVQRASFRDHQARLFEQLAKALATEGLFLELYFYDTDPRVCTARESSSSSPIAELQKKYPEHRLLLFTEGEELLDPISGELAPWVALLHDWRERALLTPREAAAWGLREKTLEEAFVVLPATVLGISELANRFELSARPDPASVDSRKARPPLPASERSISLEDLRSHLGEPGFRWLCACAVYPELHWDMTLSLGALPAINQGLLREETLLQLARLPWLRRGSLPDELRLRLIEQLDPELEKEIREAVAGLLVDNPAQAGSFAASSRELQILAQKAYLAKGNRKALRRVLRQLRNFPQSDIDSDRTLLRLLEEASSSRLLLRLPAAVRRFLFERGIPDFGLRTAASTLGALAIAIALFPTANEMWDALRTEGPEPPPPQEQSSTADQPSRKPESPSPQRDPQPEPPKRPDSEPEPQDPAPQPQPPVTLPSDSPDLTTPPITSDESSTEVSEPQSPEIEVYSPQGSETDSLSAQDSMTNPATGGDSPTGPSSTPGPETTSPSGSPEISTAEPFGAEAATARLDLKDALLSMLSQFQGNDKKIYSNLYLAGNIPEKKLRNARRAARVPKDEEVIALIDNTVWGGARNSFIIGRRGIYYRDLGTEPTYIPYEEFAKIEIKVGRNLFTNQITFEKGRDYTFLLIPANKLARMLQDIQLILRNTEPPQNGPEPVGSPNEAGSGRAAAQVE